jgi:hypothetical protein
MKLNNTVISPLILLLLVLPGLTNASSLSVVERNNSIQATIKDFEFGLSESDERHEISTSQGVFDQLIETRIISPIRLP